MSQGKEKKKKPTIIGLKIKFQIVGVGPIFNPLYLENDRGHINCCWPTTQREFYQENKNKKQGDQNWLKNKGNAKHGISPVQI